MYNGVHNGFGLKLQAIDQSRSYTANAENNKKVVLQLFHRFMSVSRTCASTLSYTHNCDNYIHLQKAQPSILERP